MLKREEIWIITREYAGIAEAGGVKNVAQSLSEGLARLGKKVTVFIPKYGCVTDFALELFSAEIRSAGKTYPVTFSKTHSGTVDILFVESPVFAEKHAVYTYTERDEKTIPGAVRGQGHADADNMNAVFQLAVLVYAEKTGSAPAVVHCQDGHTAIIPALAREGSAYFGDVRALFRHTGFVTTVHNAGAGYRQVIYDPEYARALTGLPEGVLDKSVFHGRVEPFLLAAEYGLLSTVSPWYAEELVSPACDKDTDGLSGEFARRGIQITGITNGIDFHRYDPSNPVKSYLPFPYMPWFKDLRGKYRFREMLLKNQDLLDTGSVIRTGYLTGGSRCVFFAYQGRIAEQKGLLVLIEAAEKLLAEVPGARLLIMGQGDRAIETSLEIFAEAHPGKAVFLRGYNKIIARRILCAADFLVLPSVYEPCGLEDYIAQTLGTIPIAHAVGGLQKIRHGKTGYLYREEPGKPQAETLAELLIALGKRAADADPVCSADPEFLEIIAKSAVNVMKKCDWSAIITEQYLPLYRASKPKNR